MSAPTSPLFLERYELKYFIPFELVEPISRYVSAYCEMDYYSKIAPDNFYIINSLYFDTPRLHILQSKVNSGFHKFNLRVRGYGERPLAPVFFEAKHNVGSFVKKKRAKVNRENWPDLFIGHLPFYEDSETINQKFLIHFLDLAEIYNAKPRILTQYRRKAYLSVIDEYARVTFDRDLRYQLEENYNVIPDDKKMSHYDNPNSFKNMRKNIVLELKCERKIPVWFLDLIRKFQLVELDFSKFNQGMETAYGQEHKAFSLYRNPH